MVGLSRKRVFPKTKGDSITGQDRAQKHCDFRFSQIEKKSKVAVLQLQFYLFIVPTQPIVTSLWKKWSAMLKVKINRQHSEKIENLFFLT